MKLDTTTLMVAGGITTALSGLLLLGVWTQMRRTTALLWWFAANTFYAAGIVVLAVGFPARAMNMVVAGSLISNIAPPMIWIGMRSFNRRPAPDLPAMLVVPAWLAVDLIALTTRLAPFVSFGGWVAWMSASAFELWRGRAERIPARWPLIAAFLVHALVYAGGVYDALTGSSPLQRIAPLDTWFGAIFFEGMAYAMTSAILMALICKERETLEYMRAARRDSLTGIANHGALLESAGRIFERCRRDGVPVSLIMFDLDHFKAVNDLYGHRAGDEILQAFVDTVLGLLRPTDLFGRYGGEEFAVILPGATIEAAQAIAERVRHAFAERHRFLDGRPLNATVSAGVAEAGAGMTFEAVFDAADRAMYDAKVNGRNRVERTPRRPSDDGHDAIVRIA